MDTNLPPASNAAGTPTAHIAPSRHSTDEVDDAARARGACATTPT